jgi:hypothetical protein
MKVRELITIVHLGSCFSKANTQEKRAELDQGNNHLKSVDV